MLVSLRGLRTGRVLATLGLLLVAGGIAAPAASAHDELAGSTPSGDSVVESPPTAVVLRFGGQPLAIGATVIVADSDGVDHAVGDPVVEGDTVTAAVDALPVDRNYQVRWRIVSGDGAVVSGHFEFGVGDVSDAAEIPEPKSNDLAAQRPPSGDDAGDFEVAAASPVTERDDDGTGAGSVALLAVFGALAGVGSLTAVHELIGLANRRGQHQIPPREEP